MSTLIQGSQVRSIALGVRVEKSTGTLAATTVPLFTIAGGLVAVTSLVGRVTTAITVANSYKLQHNPTLGTTRDVFSATDLGTTDTAAGEIIVPLLDAAAVVTVGARGQKTGGAFICDSGQIESVSAGTDGAILWVLTYVPIDNGASVVAA
ncbi:hypothetical protein ACFWIW_10695 [Amycolatopsis sp. NPDC058340]|uniref:hypothetical protein n=1 Tax=Amycolatopsis sp. NPDC058340 TaxID=3346453 RepID=UPI00364D1AAB